MDHSEMSSTILFARLIFDIPDSKRNLTVQEILKNVVNTDLKVSK